MSQPYVYEEYQGFDNLYFAEITKDDATAYTAGTLRLGRFRSKRNAPRTRSITTINRF